MAVEHPVGGAVRRVAGRADDDVVAGSSSARSSSTVVSRARARVTRWSSVMPPVAGLDAADRRRPDVGRGGRARRWTSPGPPGGCGGGGGRCSRSVRLASLARVVCVLTHHRRTVGAMNEHPHHDHDATHHLDFDSPEVAAYAELEGEVLLGLARPRPSPCWPSAAGAHGVDGPPRARHRVRPGRRHVPPGPAVRGGRPSSPSTGRPTMLERAAARAERLGPRRTGGDPPGRAPRRARTPWAAPTSCWASMVLHHVGDEAAALAPDPGACWSRAGCSPSSSTAGPVRVLPDRRRPGSARPVGPARCRLGRVVHRHARRPARRPPPPHRTR